MSYNITLNDANGNILHLPNNMQFQEGGTQRVGGTTECKLNVTYNYLEWFDFNHLHGKTFKETIIHMLDAVLEYGTVPDDDYWKPTPGNVGIALARLIIFGIYNPTGIWKID